MDTEEVKTKIIANHWEYCRQCADVGQEYADTALMEENYGLIDHLYEGQIVPKFQDWYNLDWIRQGTPSYCNDWIEEEIEEESYICLSRLAEDPIQFTIYYMEQLVGHEKIPACSAMMYVFYCNLIFNLLFDYITNNTMSELDLENCIGFLRDIAYSGYHSGLVAAMIDKDKGHEGIFEGIKHVTDFFEGYYTDYDKTF